MTFEDEAKVNEFKAALEILSGYYNKALKSKYVRKPLSWALYQTWKHFNSREKARWENDLS